MTAQLALQIPETGARTLRAEVERLVESGAMEMRALKHAQESGAITLRHFADWRDRVLSAKERRRVGAYFRAVLRRRIVRGSDPAAHSARRTLVATTIERDLVEAGWERSRARSQALEATGLACSA